MSLFLCLTGLRLGTWNQPSQLYFNYWDFGIQTMTFYTGLGWSLEWWGFAAVWGSCVIMGPSGRPSQFTEREWRRHSKSTMWIPQRFLGSRSIFVRPGCTFILLFFFFFSFSFSATPTAYGISWTRDRIWATASTYATAAATRDL